MDVGIQVDDVDAKEAAPASESSSAGMGQVYLLKSPEQPLPELGLPTVEMNPTLLAASNDNDGIHPHPPFASLAEDIPIRPEDDGGVIAALLSSLSPNATRVLSSSSEGLRSPEMISLQMWQGPPPQPTGTNASSMEFLSSSFAAPLPLSTPADNHAHDVYQPAPVNFQLVDDNDSRGPVAFV